MNAAAPPAAPPQDDAATPPAATPPAATPPAATPPAATPPAATPPAAAPPARRRRRRWLRVVLPFAAAVLVLIATGVAHSVTQPDPTALSPVNTGPDGGSRLAQSLAADGIDIQRVTKSSDALVAGYAGNVTLFVPTPALMHPYYLRMLKLLPATTRVVLVAPGGYTLDDGNIPVAGVDTRWATATALPGCALPEAARAGAAAVYHSHYRPTSETYLSCYRGALIGVRVGPADVLLVGASDPFRNDRIGEHHNSTLAIGLLSQHSRVVWLDLRHNEPPPGLVSQSPDANLPAAPPSLGTGGSPDPDFPIQAPGDGGDGGGQADDGAPPLPVPAQFWAVIVLLAAAGLAIALARGRRLGPPVAEPLPVAVRGLETVEGRGRLYRRAKARGPALDTLRAAAIRRLLPALDLEPDATPSTVVDVLTRRTGWPAARIDAVLYGPAPATDADLVHAAAELDALVFQAIPDVHKGESG